MYKTKTKLSLKQALEIFAIKMGSPLVPVSPGEIAQRYGVTDKAIRDIWHGRSWVRETSTLLPPADAEIALSRLGRPGRGIKLLPAAGTSVLASEMKPSKNVPDHGERIPSYSFMLTSPEKSIPRYIDICRTSTQYVESEMQKNDASWIMPKVVIPGDFEFDSQIDILTVDPFQKDWPPFSIGHGAGA